MFQAPRSCQFWACLTRSTMCRTCHYFPVTKWDQLWRHWCWYSACLPEDTLQCLIHRGSAPRHNPLPFRIQFRIQTANITYSFLSCIKILKPTSLVITRNEQAEMRAYRLRCMINLSDNKMWDLITHGEGGHFASELVWNWNSLLNQSISIHCEA